MRLFILNLETDVSVFFQNPLGKTIFFLCDHVYKLGSRESMKRSVFLSDGACLGINKRDRGPLGLYVNARFIIPYSCVQK